MPVRLQSGRGGGMSDRDPEREKSRKRLEGMRRMTRLKWAGEDREKREKRKEEHRIRGKSKTTGEKRKKRRGLFG